MARTRTLAEIRQECYDLADVLESYVSKSEMDRLINEALADLYDRVVEANKDFYADETTIAVTAGTAKYALPADFYRLLAVDVQDGPLWYLLHRYTMSERLQYQSGAVDRRLTRYQVRGGELHLRPTPGWSGTIRVLYVPAPPMLSSDTDTWDGVAGWERYAVVWVARSLAAKQEADTTPHERELAALLERIQALAGDVDDSEAPRVRDVWAGLDAAYPEWWTR